MKTKALKNQKIPEKMTNNFKKLADEAFQIHLQIRDQVKKLKEIKKNHPLGTVSSRDYW